MSDWDRSMLAMTSAEFDLHEAARALERVLERGCIREESREVVARALGRIRRELELPRGEAARASALERVLG